MKFSIAFAVTTLLVALTPTSASATEGDIGPVYIETVLSTALASGGHQAGNFELKIKSGFSVPAGLGCDDSYITTLRASDATKQLFAMSLLVKQTKQPVYLRITNDPSYRAFNGRCSLVWIIQANAG